MLMGVCCLHQEYRLKDPLHSLFEEIQILEQKVAQELERRQQNFRYSIQHGRVVFEKEVQALHRETATGIRKYLMDSSLSSFAMAPVIYSLIFPALFLDLFVSVYQFLCFPVYQIQPVKRGDYIIMDRHHLKYLNWIERLNCEYCSYFNGLVAYVREVGARTEQYWCPIKHAKRGAPRHSLYKNFLDYGDMEGYAEKLSELRDRLKNL